MSRLDDLQSAAHQVSSDADATIAALGQLASDNDDAVEEAVAWGNEGGAQVLHGPGKSALEGAKEAAQTLQEKLSEYVAVVEQAKGEADCRGSPAGHRVACRRQVRRYLGLPPYRRPGRHTLTRRASPGST